MMKSGIDAWRVLKNRGSELWLCVILERVGVASGASATFMVCDLISEERH